MAPLLRLNRSTAAVIAWNGLGILVVLALAELSGEDYYVYDGHFRPSGVAVVAKTVAQELQQRR
jgi:hypothetical protein